MANVVTFRPVPKPVASRRAMDRVKAEALVAEILGYIASDDEAIAAFIHATGFDPRALRKIPRRELLVGVADFMLGSDDLIQEYAGRMEIDPETVGAAVRLISPPH